jgi:hypothetical protein
MIVRENMSDKIKVLIVDDQQLVRDGIKLAGDQG